MGLYPLSIWAPLLLLLSLALPPTALATRLLSTRTQALACIFDSKTKTFARQLVTSNPLAIPASAAWDPISGKTQLTGDCKYLLNTACGIVSSSGCPAQVCKVPSCSGNGNANCTDFPNCAAPQCKYSNVADGQTCTACTGSTFCKCKAGACVSSPPSPPPPTMPQPPPPKRPPSPPLNKPPPPLKKSPPPPAKKSPPPPAKKSPPPPARKSPPPPAPVLAPAPAPSSPFQLELFADELVVPQTVEAPANGTIIISAFKVKQKFHRDLPPTWVYAYGTSEATAFSPGPTIVAHRNQALTVHFENNITDSTHLLPVDYTLGAPKPPRGGVPITVHLHGGVMPSTSDGHPDAWWTNNGDVGPTFFSRDHWYPNVQRGSTLWYHDHTDGMTRLNVAAGMAGFYLLKEDTLEASLGLPSSEFDVPLMLGDKSFDPSSGNISFPSVGDNPSVHPFWNPEYFGDFLIVNGKISPYMNVKPALYRFRLLNAANARFFTLTLSFGDTPIGFSLIATDAGLLSEPVPTTELSIAPGERVEILVDFSQLPSGSSVVMQNSAPAPFPGGDVPATDNLINVMKFSVSGAETQTALVSTTLETFERLQKSDASTTRYITMSEKENEITDSPEYSLLEGLHWRDPVSIIPKLGSTEIWEIINLTDDWHPFHIHFAPHQLLHRQPFDRESYGAGNCTITGEVGKRSCYTGPAIPAQGKEIAWKDTTQTPSHYVTTLIIRFGPVDGETLPFDPTAGPGYVYHCHILDHEDNDMMRPYTLKN